MHLNKHPIYFILILAIFTLVGFTTKYCLMKFGWVDQGNKNTKEYPIIRERVPQNSVPYSPEDLKNAKKTAMNFIILYKSNYSPSIQKLRNLATPRLFSMIQEEAGSIQNASYPIKTRLIKLQKILCQQEQYNVRCISSVLMEEQNREQENNNKKSLFEGNYELEIVKISNHWVVEDVNPIGSFD